MSRKVFISVLGAGLYEKCKYQSGVFCSAETNFVQLATLNYLRNLSVWPSDSRAYILLTEKAKKENWIVESNQRYHNQKNGYVSYVGLKTALERVSLGFLFEGVSIPDGKDENEMWKFFETLYNLLEEGDELYFDLTHRILRRMLLLSLICFHCPLYKIGHSQQQIFWRMDMPTDLLLYRIKVWILSCEMRKHGLMIQSDFAVSLII